MTRALFSQNDDVCWGDVVFAGTRIPVDSVIDRFVAGESLRSIREDYDGITEAHVEAALRLGLKARSRHMSVARYFRSVRA